jgi:hypothetical protein
VCCCGWSACGIKDDDLERSRCNVAVYRYVLAAITAFVVTSEDRFDAIAIAVIALAFCSTISRSEFRDNCLHSFNMRELLYGIGLARKPGGYGVAREGDGTPEIEDTK